MAVPHHEEVPDSHPLARAGQPSNLGPSAQDVVPCKRPGQEPKKEPPSNPTPARMLREAFVVLET